eukprot:TRINITY_DN6734_c0_g1_i8.p1 TRINITY_DN6734_c0_g1~~TRINITY_DN6734_c0_g1_i8.p1  ORF type:complete len:171 (-),score=33.64 TRINITY_DN6734_c0_g1_i8:96-608(-)
MTTITKDLEERLASRPSMNSDQQGMANMASLTYNNDRLSQYTRRESVRTAGVKMPQGETAQQVEEKALKIFTDAGASVAPDDIAAVHRADKPRNGTQAVLVKFVSRRKRREVMEKKKTVRDKPDYKGIFLNDDLIPLRARLLGFVQRHLPERRPHPTPCSPAGICTTASS